MRPPQWRRYERPTQHRRPLGNRDKKSERHPNAKGDGNLTITADYINQHWDGQSYLAVPLDLAAWTKQSDRAGKFLSLSIKLKGDQKSAPRQAKAPSHPHDGQPEEEDLAW
jgi:hypothetical protein